MTEGTKTCRGGFKFSPRTIIARGLWILAFSLFAIALARLAATAWQLETAPGLLSATFRDATLGWLGWGHERINDAPAGRQADFWIAETDRLLSEEPTCEMARGAAWMLDSPGLGFDSRNPWLTDLSSGERDFEAKAGRKCIQFAERATRLAPKEARAWRTRALLLLRSPISTNESEPRDPGWLAVLDEAARHDQDNGLYDCLAAHTLWNESSRRGDEAENFRLIITDQKRFSEGTMYFERALEKPFARAGEDDWPAIVRFFERSSVPKHEHPELISNRLLEARQSFLFHMLFRTQLERAELESPKEKVRLLRQCLRFAETVGASQDLTSIGIAHVIGKGAAAVLAGFLEKHPDGFSASETSDIKNQLLSAHVRNLVWKTASGELLKSYPHSSPSSSVIPWDLLLGWLLASAALLGLIALIAWWGSRILLTPVDIHRPGLHVVRDVLCWLIAFGVSFVLLGLAPAQVISIPTQQILSKLLIVLVPVASLGGLLVFILRRRKWQFRLWELFIAVPVFGALSLIAAHHITDLLSPDTGCHMPARLESAAKPENTLMIISTSHHGTIVWALVQWNAYPGTTTAIALALFLIGCWSWRRSGRDKRFSGLCNRRSRVRGMAVEIGRSAAWVAVLSLLAFLVFAPTFLRECQANYDSQMAWFHNLQERRESMAAKVKALESNPAKMKELRELAEQEIAADRATEDTE
jgi:hypothetical protein